MGYFFVLDFYCIIILKWIVFWRKEKFFGGFFVLEINIRLNGIKRENGGGNNERRKKNEYSFFLFKEIKWVIWICLGVCRVFYKGENIGWCFYLEDKYLVKCIFFKLKGYVGYIDFIYWEGERGRRGREDWFRGYFLVFFLVFILVII